MSGRKPRIFWEMKVDNWTVRLDQLSKNYLLVTFYHEGLFQSVELWRKLEEDKE